MKIGELLGHVEKTLNEAVLDDLQEFSRGRNDDDRTKDWFAAVLFFMKMFASPPDGLYPWSPTNAEVTDKNDKGVDTITSINALTEYYESHAKIAPHFNAFREEVRRDFSPEKVNEWSADIRKLFNAPEFRMKFKKRGSRGFSNM